MTGTQLSVNLLMLQAKYLQDKWRGYILGALQLRNLKDSMGGGVYPPGGAGGRLSQKLESLACQLLQRPSYVCGNVDSWSGFLAIVQAPGPRVR